MTEPRAYVLAVDPGRVNGVALVRREDLAKVHSAELSWEGLVDYVARVLHEYGAAVEVVVEAFRISPATAKNAKGALETIEVVGMVRLLVKQYTQDDPNALPLQTVGEAEHFTDSAKLRALGWWHRGGKGHANMALRHCALRLLHTGVRDRRLLGLE